MLGGMQDTLEMLMSVPGYGGVRVGRGGIVRGDSFGWLAALPEASLHGVVTDPPYGVKEYGEEQLGKRAAGRGGVWRLPPAYDGHVRAPLPRFTALTGAERQELIAYFRRLGELLARALLPGGHVFVASNAFLSQPVFAALIDGGLEYRGQVIRLVSTLRGGDRPKGAEAEFAGVSSLLRGAHEPWGVLRRPLPRGMTVGECLRRYGTGALRRRADGAPLLDVIPSARTPRREREVADHPSLKPQGFVRQLVYAVLPLGQGVVVDPFMGAGSTVAAAEALGLSCVGVERHARYYEMSQAAIPRLAQLG